MRQLKSRLHRLETASLEGEIARYETAWADVPRADLELIAAGDPGTMARYKPVFEPFSLACVLEHQRRQMLQAGDSDAEIEQELADLESAWHQERGEQ